MLSCSRSLQIQAHFCWEAWARLRSRGTLTVTFKARTASLCSHISADAVNRTQRIGTECFVANSTHLLRTSESALVLSVRCQRRIFSHAVQFEDGYVPTATDFPSSRYSPATLIHFSRFRVSVKTHGVLHECNNSLFLKCLDLLSRIREAGVVSSKTWTSQRLGFHRIRRFLGHSS